MSVAVSPFDSLGLRTPWPPSQARLLAALEGELRAPRLELLVAAGGGRIRLGLELFRRLGRPALILTPTPGQRQRWFQGLDEFFIGAPAEGLLSDNPHHPGLLTVLTYPSLLANADDDPDALARAPDGQAGERLAECLRGGRFGLLILDEAQQLHPGWWRLCASVIASLPALQVLSLDSSPPDLADPRWPRFHALGGGARAALTTAELVREGVLTPHQDYVYAVALDIEDQERLRAWDAAVTRLCQTLPGDPELQAAVAAHPLLGRRPSPALALESPALALALLGYRQAAGQPLPAPLLRLLGLKRDAVPELDRAGWQRLLRAYLFDSHWPAATLAHREALGRRLQDEGLLERRQPQLLRPPGLGLSPARLDACIAIHRLERRHRGADLRQLLVTDLAGVEPGGTTLAAWPLFRRLAVSLPAAEVPGLALFSPELSLLHTSRLAEAHGLETQPHPDLPDFLQVGGPGLAATLARLLDGGRLQVVVATLAAVDGPWAPTAFNSLVLACDQAAPLLARQLRALVAAADPPRPWKRASLWHPIAVDPDTPHGLAPLQALEQRFRTFEGVGVEAAELDSGLGRLELPRLAQARDLETWNREMELRLRAERVMAERWRQAVEAGQAPAPTLEAGPACALRWPRRAHLLRSLKLVLAQLLLAALAVASEALFSTNTDELRVLGLTGLIAAALGTAWILPKLLGSLWRYLNHLPEGGGLRQAALALLDALVRSGRISTRRRRLKLRTQTHPDGGMSFRLDGARFHEQSLFIDALGELLGPVERPEWLLVRRRWFGAFRDCRAVPWALAEDDGPRLLQRAWKRRVGPVSLLPAGAGRRALLRVRIRQRLAGDGHRALRHDPWT